MDSYVKAWLLLAVAMVVWAGPAQSAATTFTVGDTVGWTIRGMPNYTEWASGKTFHVGDTILFQYNNQFHNVLEVKEADFNACKNSSYINEYKTGEDSIIIKSTGHHYFICGTPGHCQIGQKVDILAVGSSAAPSSSPSDSSSPSKNVGDFFNGLIMAATFAPMLLGF